MRYWPTRERSKLGRKKERKQKALKEKQLHQKKLKQEGKALTKKEQKPQDHPKATSADN